MSEGYVCGRCGKSFPTVMIAWAHHMLVACYRRLG